MAARFDAKNKKKLINIHLAREVQAHLEAYPNKRILQLKGKLISAHAARVIAECIKKHNNLKDFKLFLNSIGNASSKLIASAIIENTNLKFLALGGNHTIATPLIEILQKNRTITNLKLSLFDVNTDTINLIASAIANNKYLTYLCFSEDLLEMNTANAIANIFLHNQNIKKFILKANQFAEGSIEKISKAMKHLTYFRLKNSTDPIITYNAIQSDIMAIANIINSNRYLLSFRLENFPLDTTTYLRLDNAIKNNQSIKYLTLNNCLQSYSSFKAIIDVVVTSPNICYLNCTNVGVHFPIRNPKILSDLINTHKKLSYINIGCVIDLDDIFFKELYCALTKNYNMTYMHIKYEEFERTPYNGMINKIIERNRILAIKNFIIAPTIIFKVANNNTLAQVLENEFLWFFEMSQVEKQHYTNIAESIRNNIYGLCVFSYVANKTPKGMPLEMVAAVDDELNLNKLTKEQLGIIPLYEQISNNKQKSILGQKRTRAGDQAEKPKPKQNRPN